MRQIWVGYFSATLETLLSVRLESIRGSGFLKTGSYMTAHTTIQSPQTTRFYYYAK